MQELQVVTINGQKKGIGLYLFGETKKKSLLSTCELVAAALAVRWKIYTNGLTKIVKYKWQKHIALISAFTPDELLNWLKSNPKSPPKTNIICQLP